MQLMHMLQSIASTRQTFYDIMPKTESCSSYGFWSVLLYSGWWPL